MGAVIVLGLYTLVDDVVEAIDENKGVTKVVIPMVVTSEKLLLVPRPQILRAITVKLYFVLGVNPLTVHDAHNVSASPLTPSSLLQLTMYLLALSTSSHCTTNDVAVMLLKSMFTGVPGGPGRSVV